MPEHPPPAPDWILGEDGHWKPPPFTAGRPAAPLPPTAGPVPPAPPPPTALLAPAWGPPPPGSPLAGPIPGPQSGSTGRTVAVVLGTLGVAGVAFVGLLVGAVTFLGTSSEPRSTPVASSLPDDDGFTTVGDEIGPSDETDAPAAGDAPDPGAAEPDPDDAVEPAASESELTAVAVEVALGEGWIATRGEPVEVDPEAVAGTCAPAGWLGGAVDRFRAYFDRPGGEVTDALTLSLTTYADDASATADLGRARSEEYRVCEEAQHRDEFGTDATATLLPDDPQAPGATYEIVSGGPTPRTEYDITVIVGRLRAHLDFCGCADLGLEGQRAVARQVAAVLAERQGRATPG